MPSIEDFNLPPPKSDDKLEDLIWDLYRRIWNDPEAQRVGRSGQRQHGVDIVGRPDAGEDLAGVQVKLRTSRLSKSELRNAVTEALQFRPPLATFVTTAPTDARLQEVARETTRDHLAKGLFLVSVLGWQEVERRLLDYPNLVRKHYAGLFPLDQQDAAPTLRLELRDEGDRALDGREFRIVSLVLSNHSSVVATQYQFQLQLPFLPPTLTQPIGPRRILRPVAASDGHGKWVDWREGETIGVTFMSNGALSVLPSFPQVLGQFWIPRGWFGAEPRPVIYPCRYALVSGVGAADEGVLELPLFALQEGCY
jgi:hypothetical protein